jgi:hypothetical protein
MTNSAMKLAQSNLFELADRAAEDMKFIEGDTKLADLQGFCAGTETAKELLQAAGFEIIADEDRECANVSNMSLAELMPYEAGVLEITGTKEWVDFLDKVEDAEAEKKEFLYSEECTKGRDLAFVHGWKKAVRHINRTLQAILTFAENERAKGPELEF